MSETTSSDHEPVAGGPTWQDDPYATGGGPAPWTHPFAAQAQPTGAYWTAPVAPPLAEAPGEAGGGRGGRRRHGVAGRRRRFGALALTGALVAGGAAGAVTAALLGRSTTVVQAASARTAADFAGSATSGTAQSIISKIEPALVDIHTTTSSSSSSAFGNGMNPFGSSGTTTSEAAGTGMIIRSDGLILTNAHVLEGATSITVTYDGTTTTHTATLVGEDAAKDIALIQVQGASNLPTVTLGDSSSVVSGDQVLAIGNALDLQNGGFTASEGIISGLNRSIQTDNDESLTGLLQTSAPISSGDSGGPLVDASGQVIGMDTASAASTSENTASDVGFSIPSNEITSLISQLEKGSVGQTTVGSSGSSSSSSASGSSGSSSQYGTYPGSEGGYGSESGTGGYEGNPFA